MWNVECGIDERSSYWYSAFRIPHSALSRRRAPLGIHVMLQQQRRRPRVHVRLAAARGAAQLTDGLEHAGGGEPLVPQLDRAAAAPGDVGGEGARGGGGRTFGGRGVQREADDDPHDGVVVQERDEFLHWEPLPGAAGQRGEGLRERLGLVGEGQTDAALTPIHAEQPSRPGGHPCCIVWKNSSKMTSSMREPVSMSAVPTIVSEPPPSILRAAPKKRFGFCSALASTPPERILPECGTTTLWARPMRVIESSRITTSLPCSTSRFAFSITMSATWTWRSAGSSNVEEITSTFCPLTFSSMSVTSSGRSSMSSTMR